MVGKSLVIARMHTKPQSRVSSELRFQSDSGRLPVGVSWYAWSSSEVRKYNTALGCRMVVATESFQLRMHSMITGKEVLPAWEAWHSLEQRVRC